LAFAIATGSQRITLGIRGQETSFVAAQLLGTKTSLPGGELAAIPMHVLIVGVLSLFASLISDATPASQAQLSRDIEAANREFRDDLTRFWRGIDSNDLRVMWHLVGWEWKFAKTVSPQIIDAIMGDLRQNKTSYPGARAAAGVLARSGEYEGIIACLDRREAKRILMKWRASGRGNDRLYAVRFLKTLRESEIAPQADGSIYWQRRSFLSRWFF
jgi:hypothetical protein